MSSENLKQISLERLESLKSRVDYELLERDGVSPEIFLKIHTADRGCLVTEELVGFSNADIEGGFIIGATEIMRLDCNTHRLKSSFYAKGHVIKQEKREFIWRWCY